MAFPWMLTQPMAVPRAAHRRSGTELARARAVVTRGGEVLAHEGRAVLVPVEDRPEHVLSVYLGTVGDEDVLAVEVGADTGSLLHGDFTPLREFLRANSALDEGDAETDPATASAHRELAATAVALAAWHAAHQFCGRCGQPTHITQSGWVRRCDNCERDAYPRVDPAMIVAITDDQDRLLLAHASYWSPKRFSHLAGYVEPGESLEQAVHREVEEESGLKLAELEYVGSQPWPFPASMMIGFRARAASTTLRLDEDEITEAGWFTREELADAVASGAVILPPAGSIARELLTDWVERRHLSQ